jgi:hypothetical protein
MKDGEHHPKTKDQTATREIIALASGPVFVMFTAIVVLVTYGLDIMTPLGMPVWLLYFLPLAFSYWSDQYYAIPTLCLVILLFLAAGLFFSQEGGIHISIALIIRIAFGIVIIAVSSVLWMAQRKRIHNEIVQASWKLAADSAGRKQRRRYWNIMPTPCVRAGFGSQSG